MDFVIPRYAPYGAPGALIPITGKKSAKKEAQVDDQKPRVKKVTPPANAKLNSSKEV